MRTLLAAAALLALAVPLAAQDPETSDWWAARTAEHEERKAAAIREVGFMGASWRYVGDSVAVDTTWWGGVIKDVVTESFGDLEVFDARRFANWPATEGLGFVRVRLWTVKGSTIVSYHLDVDCETGYYDPTYHFGSQEFLGFAPRGTLRETAKETVEEAVRACALDFYRSRSRATP